MYSTQTVKEGSFLCTISTLRVSLSYGLHTREAFVAAAGDSTLAFTQWLRILLRRSPISSITSTLSFFRSSQSVILAAGNIACYTSGKSGLHLGLRLATAKVNHTRYALHLMLAYL